jgi:hypothetical protein
MSGKIEISRDKAERMQACLEAHKYTESTKLAKELSAILAAPVVERQPDAYMTVNPNGMKALFFPSKNIEPSPLDRPLYTSPPAPVALVLPERKPRPVEDFHGSIWVNEGDCMWVDGWNTCIDEAGRMGCLDKVKELNQ